MPFLKSEGSVVINGKVVDIVGDATFIHAIQGMRPDSVSPVTIHGRQATAMVIIGHGQCRYT
jgi:hypothetical protein